MKGIESISEGVAVAGSVAEAAGIEFEELASIVASIAETTRTEGSVIGNAMKTIMARISRSKTADPDVSAADRSQAALAFKEVAGIDLYDKQGNYKDLTETLNELSLVWEELSDSERNYLSEQAAGVHNINVFTTMMNKYAQSQELAKSAIEDSDYYLEVQDKYMESMQAKINTLRASIQEFWNSFIDTGTINFGIGLLTGIVNVGQNIVGVFTSIKTLIGGTAGSIISFGAATASVVTTLKAVHNIKDKGNIIGGLLQTKSDIGSGIGGVLGFILDKNKRKETIDNMKKFAQQGQDMAAKINGTYAKADGINSLAQGFGLLAGKIGISTTALAGFLGIAGGITAAVLMFNHFTKTSAEAAEKAKELRANYEAAQETLRSRSELIDGSGLEWETLSKGVDDFGKNISLTTDEFSRYNEITNQIADMFPTLVSGYTDQGNAIINLTNGLKDLNAEYEKQAALEAKSRLDDGLDGYQEDFNNAIGNESSWTRAANAWSETVNFESPQMGKTISYKAAFDTLKEIQNKNEKEVLDYINELSLDVSDSKSYELSRYLKDTLDISPDSDISTDDGLTEWKTKWASIQKEIPSIIRDAQSELDLATQGMRNSIDDLWTVMSLNGGAHSNLDSETKNLVDSLLSKLNPEEFDALSYLNPNDGTSQKDMQMYIDNIITSLQGKNGEEIKTKLKAVISLDEEASVEEISNALTGLESIVNDNGKIAGIELNNLKVMFDLEGKEEFVKEYTSLVNEITSSLDEEALRVKSEILENNMKSGGTISLDNKKTGTAENLKKAGWNLGEDDGSSYMANIMETKDATFVITPVMENGDVLSPDALTDYFNETIAKGKEDINGLVIASFDKKDVKNGRDTRKEAEKLVDELKDAEKQSDYLGDNQELITDLLESSNIKTSAQVDLLKQCYEETGNWIDAFEKFNVDSVDLSLNEEMLDALEANLDVVKTNIENINDAIEGTNSTVGMSREQIENVVKAFSGLDSYDYDQLFESTAEGVKLNTEELEKLNREYEKQEADKHKKTIEGLEEQYTNICERLGEVKSGTEEYNNLLTKRDGLKQQIKDAQELQSMYEGLTNSVTKYMNAKQSTDPDADYLTLTEDLENIEEMWDHGEIGRDDFKTFIQMYTDQQLVSYQDYKDAYQEAIGKAKRYLTENGEGAENFLNDLQSKGMASKLSDGAWDIDADIEEMADKLGMTQAAIQEMFNRLKVYGFDIDFKESEDYLKKLREEAEEANKIFSGNDKLKINLDLSDYEELKKLHEQLSNEDFLSNAKKNLSTKEYDALLKQIDYIEARMGEISEKTYSVDINSADGLKELEKNLKKLKELGQIDFDIDFENNDLEYIEKKIKDVVESAKELKRNSKGYIEIDQEGGQETISVLAGLIEKRKEIEFNKRIVYDIDTSKITEDASKTIEALKKIEEAHKNLSILEEKKEIGIEVNDEKLEEAKTALANVTKEFIESNPTVSASLKLNNIDFNSEDVTTKIRETMDNIDAGMILTIDGVDDTAFVNYTPDEKTVTIGVDDSKVRESMKNTDDWAAQKKLITFEDSTNSLLELKNIYDTIKDKTVNISVNQSVNETTTKSGNAKVNGTANVNGNASIPRKIGSAFVRGTWGAAKRGLSLVGELGRELVCIKPV